ncbi:hypothetical protein GGQ73_003667 [Rhizobium skierniewicense]|uniref:DUF4376 domain-containing protein n=1 Tax=Rhizobium skierniewicense TaxID=984260 RepID=A0A7W6CA98_9HYPH|nr:DUF4376 domain-containing protein [Rhizobium skierniewicense]MBB3947696.1 hypothetical protein [Rhizobium skierniewicense]
MTIYVKVADGVVTDRAVFDGTIPKDWPDVELWTKNEEAQIGWQLANGVFSPPLKPTASATKADVDIERDKRIAVGFIYSGKLFQARQFDLDNIRSMATAASVKIVQGAQDGDLRWFDPSNDFYWIAADNTTLPMSAPDMVEFAMTAAAWGSKHILAAAALKAMSPIPADFTDNKWWP